MELRDALRTTGAVREFADEPVGDHTVYRLLEAARFAPNGGNRQAWRVVLVRDPARRAALRDLYLQGWYPYLAMAAAGLTPWAPVTDRQAESEAAAAAPALAEQASGGPGGFAEHFDRVPVLLVVLADLRRLAAVDRDFDRYTMVGGASIYPFVWSLLLAARDEGLGGVITTMAVRGEAELRRLLGVPEEYAVAAVVALGRPLGRARRLRRAPVESFASVDSFDGPPLFPGGPGGAGSAPSGPGG